MTEENRLRLKDQMIPEFVITSSMDYPDQGAAKVRGMINQLAITITWDYWEDIENVTIETMNISGQSNFGPCPIDKLKDVLKTFC